MNEYKGKVAIVTGGATGIGRGISEALARKSATVCLVYSSSEKEAEETKCMIEAQGGRALAIRADVSDERQVIQMVDSVLGAYGAIHYLVNCAGATEYIPLSDLDAITDELWDRLMQVNMKSMFYCIRAVAPAMRKTKPGSILNIGSLSAITGEGSSLPYAVSKSAVHGLTKSLARALAPDIRVNCLAPGLVMSRWWLGRNPKTGNLLERITMPEELGDFACAILAQPSLTGQIISPNDGVWM